MVQPLIKLTDTNNGINFSLDFIIDYLSLWQKIILCELY